jgi:hypothetical protein
MVLGQGRYWRASLHKGGDGVGLALLRETLPEDLQELRDLKLDVPLEKWNAVVKHVSSDRKMLGGILLDFANHKDALARALSTDRLLDELRRVALEATATLVGDEILVLAPLEKKDR